MSQNKQKVILITGASSGIGKVSALHLLNEGYKVYAAARRIEQMKDIEAAGGKSIRMDITKEEDVQNAVQMVMNEAGCIDVLINNAGYGFYGPIEDTPIEEARKMFDVNLFGLARLTQLVLPIMRKQGHGRIINVSSMAGKIYMPLGGWYHGSKHALEAWSDSLRLEVKPFNIDVVIIEPGIILTEFGQVMLENMAKIPKDSAYRKLIEAYERASRKSYGKGGGTPPEAIARVMSKAVKARRPKIRYRKGKYSVLMPMVRKIFGDRIFDAIILSQIK